MLRLTGVWIGIYPIVAHFGLWFSSPRLAVTYLMCLLMLVLLYPPRYRQLKNKILASSLVVTVVILAFFNLDYILIYIPPVVIPMALLVLFLQSLGKDQIPVITQFANKMAEDNLGQEQIDYTRKVTQLWVIVFAVMVVEAIGLAIFARLEIWSWFTHIGNYGLIGFVLVIEFIYRKRRFKQKGSSFKQFITALAKHRWK